MGNKYSIKIGQIEFSLEGDADYIENERSVFFQNILPQATEAMLKAQTSWRTAPPIEIAAESSTELLTSNKVDIHENKLTLNEFLNDKGYLNQQDSVLFLVYYAEKYNNLESFSSDDIKQLFRHARLSLPTNISAIIYYGVKKGLFVENEKDSKRYQLTRTAIEYIESYQPKEKSDNPKKLRKSKNKKTIESKYKGITKDDLNTAKYPDISSFDKFIDKMMLVMYIFTNEKKGDLFSVIDLMYILTDIFGEKVTVKQINGIFDRNRTWFNKLPVEGSKIIERKLLNDGIKYCENLISTREN